MGIAGRDRATAPRALGRTNRRRFTPGQSNPIARPRPARSSSPPTPPRIPGPELTATATILTLSDTDCRWPIGDPQEAAFGYCGRFRGRHVSYCDHHAGVAIPKRSPARAVAGLAKLFDQFAGG